LTPGEYCIYSVYMRFDWDAHNRKKLGAHGVTTREFEQAFAVRLIEERNLVGRERRKIAVGHTEAGRVLVLVYTIRRGKVRAVTAYESRKAREQWQKK
jgi:uncharacterized protein